MRITVLGKSPSWQDVDGACSGYLVEQEAACILLDCGSGVFGKLRRFRDYATVDAVVISHLHADHFLDLVPFAYALRFSPRDLDAHPRLIAPPGARDTFRRVAGAWGSEDLVERAFELEEYAAGDHPRVGPLEISFQPVEHFRETFAVAIEANGRRFVFGADSAPTDDLPAFARDADLLFLEATIREPEPDGDRGHMTPREAGEQGRAAAAKRLILTHLTDELDEAWARHEASDAFGGEVDVAREAAVFEL